jgi:hypothetical protein
MELRAVDDFSVTASGTKNRNLTKIARVKTPKFQKLTQLPIRPPLTPVSKLHRV